jgi:hypothetical protein
VRVQRYFGSAWSMAPEGRVYDVHIHFDPKVATDVAEVQWHSSQRIRWNDDGSLEFFARVDGLGEIAWWVLGYGSCAEVIAPEPLRKSVLQSAMAMVQRYQEESAPRKLPPPAVRPARAESNSLSVRSVSLSVHRCPNASQAAPAAPIAPASEPRLAR